MATTSPFFRLPLELREKIYEYVLNSNDQSNYPYSPATRRAPLMDSYSATDIAASSDPRTLLIPTSPFRLSHVRNEDFTLNEPLPHIQKLFSLNKEIYNEARSVFLRTRKLDVNVRCLGARAEVLRRAVCEYYGGSFNRDKYFYAAAEPHLGRAAGYAEALEHVGFRIQELADFREADIVITQVSEFESVKEMLKGLERALMPTKDRPFAANDRKWTLSMRCDFQGVQKRLEPPNSSHACNYKPTIIEQFHDFIDWLVKFSQRTHVRVIVSYRQATPDGYFGDEFARWKLLSLQEKLLDVFTSGKLGRREKTTETWEEVNLQWDRWYQEKGTQVRRSETFVYPEAGGLELKVDWKQHGGVLRRFSIHERAQAYMRGKVGMKMLHLARESGVGGQRAEIDIAYVEEP